MFFQQLDWFNSADRMFFLFAYMLPLVTVVFGSALVVEYKLATRKRKRKNKRGR